LGRTSIAFIPFLRSSYGVIHQMNQATADQRATEGARRRYSPLPRLGIRRYVLVVEWGRPNRAQHCDRGQLSMGGAIASTTP
jgi:hypothetical protein